METEGAEFLAATLELIERQEAAGTPWFLWFNTTRMGISTHLQEDADGATGRGIYADGMVEHDQHVSVHQYKLDEFGITDNTIVI